MTLWVLGDRELALSDPGIAARGMLRVLGKAERDIPFFHGEERLGGFRVSRIFPFC